MVKAERFDTGETEYVREGAVNLPADPTPRDIAQRAVALRAKLDYNLGHNLIGRDNLRVGRVAIIAAANSASFGWSLARGILQAHPENSVVVTGREPKKLRQAEKNRDREITRNPAAEGRIEIREYDVTKPTLIGEKGTIDNVVIAAAYIPQEALSLDIKTVSDVDPAVLQQGRDVVVDGFKRTTEVLAPMLIGGAVYGVTFAGHTLPGYVVMGQLKAELEEAVLGDDLTEDGIGQGIFSLGAYESAASLAIDGFRDGSMTRGLYEKLGLQNPTMREMVWPAIAAMADENLHRELIHLDGGLRKVLATDDGAAAYDAYLEEMTSAE